MQSAPTSEGEVWGAGNGTQPCPSTWRLGQMGAGMAASLLRAGHEVTVFNRTRSKGAALVAQGAVAAPDLAQACGDDTVVTMLADDAALEAVVFGPSGVLAHLRRAAIHVSSSTISVDLSERLTRDHAAAGHEYGAAPVFGRPEVAAAGELAVIAAGEAAVLARAAPLLDAIGRRTFVVSATCGSPTPTFAVVNPKQA
jgi:3-hydroxyisobutyrate dehydrogenase-like beta-hydroxyacid dehydrogenase